MKHVFSILIIFSLIVSANAQQKRDVSLAFFSTQNNMPFGKFAGMFKEIVHPGVELGYGRTFQSAQKHEWFISLKLAYFYHRFVQHGFPLYIDFGYRYKAGDRWSFETSIGAGYMHSIPATDKFKLDDNGEYVNNKKAGRMQAMAAFSIGTSYTFNPASPRPLSIFTKYQQRLQFPFVKSYVPVLPYNSLFLGVRKTINK
jgi:hypothetical protein